MSDPKWKKFERLVYNIQKGLAPDAQVTWGDVIPGVDSKTNRKIDISIRRQVGQFPLLIIIDCKDYSDPVDVKDVGEFITMVRDVRANKGALVASSGFTQAAIELAKTHGIDSFRLVDTESTDWKSYVTIPVLLERAFPAQFQFELQNFPYLPPNMELDLRPNRVFTEDGTCLGTCGDLLAHKWNSKEISHESGEHEVSLGEGVLLEFEQDRIRMDIAARVRVGREYYFGHRPVQVRGLKNEQSGGIITKKFTTERFEPYKIEQGLVEGWRKIDHPEQLAVTPLIRLGYSDVLPTTQ